MFKRYIIGVDEVGRGCLAGPVTVAALAVPQNFQFSSNNFQVGLRDSKKLSPKQREQWFEYIKQQPEVLFCIARVSPRIIDKINISAAANRAAYRAIEKLIDKIELYTFYDREKCITAIKLDGGLFLKNRKHQDLNYPTAKTVVKGDEKFDTVKLASIVAKVTRDRYMKRLHKKYPDYGFHIHKGYGTYKHYSAIKKYGPSKMHRLTFLGN